MAGSCAGSTSARAPRSQPGQSAAAPSLPGSLPVTALRDGGGQRPQGGRALQPGAGDTGSPLSPPALSSRPPRCAACLSLQAEIINNSDEKRSSLRVEVKESL